METINTTKYPGDDGQPIPQFPEKLEKEVGNILGGFLVSAEGTDGSHGYFVMDREALLYELLNYITHGKQI